VRSRSDVVLFVLLAQLLALPADAAPTLKQRADKLLRFLPRPPAGWSKVEEAVEASDSAMSGKALAARRRYRKGKALEEIVELRIGIQPDGKPLYQATLVDDPAKAAKDTLNGVGYTIGEALGQKGALRTTRNTSRNRDEHTVVHRLPNGMMVSYWVWTLPVSAAAPFRKAINYAALGKLKP
jgi:hypothetical protein